MRLIDADELIKKFKYSDAHTEDENVWCATFRRMIKEQPTVDDGYNQALEDFVKECVEYKDLAFGKEHIERIKMIAEQLKR